ncbi:MAG TPA: RagB/SusD family nutrient uptake outer membrane protein [Chitinophagaceae bacterium]|nr:RagB/SusD family nutrient uptake outer membrane protein [Chitinophagaceae bacterium]
MKKIRIFLLGFILLASGISCKKTFLDETPLDFLSTTNAFKSAADFNASIYNLFRLVRDEFYVLNDNTTFDYQYRTDLAIDAAAAVPNLVGDLAPTNGGRADHWTRLYKIVAEANTVISRIPASELTDADKEIFEAKGRFFRALAYRTLVYIWGGVPLTLEEATSPKVDFVRATKKEVLTQCIDDLVFAAENLPSIGLGSYKNGDLSKEAAAHLLSEVYLADEQFQKSVDAATAVITSGNLNLMTGRFGSMSTSNPGDVYSDLFRVGNQNRSSGNREGILVIQIQANVPGGAGATNLGFANAGGYCLERVHVPLTRDANLNGSAYFRWPAGDYSAGGRGVGFMGPSFWFQDSVWTNSGTDIRNANHNFVRKFKVTNPSNPMFGQDLDYYNLPPGTKGTSGQVLVSGKPSRALYAYQAKATTPFQHPQELYDPVNRPWPYSLKDGAAFTFRDEYMFRLAETYLIRAEAYLGLGDNASAAADINVVRARSSATPVLAADVNIDYILDERMRELGVEEKRLLTLNRLGKWYDRVVKCNSYYAAQANPKYNLWPIPQRVIEANREAVITQNPGY